jgi:hypothetical protein
MTTSTPLSETTPTRHIIKGAVVRFAGDSGDGMQVTGDQFTAAAALAQNDALRRVRVSNPFLVARRVHARRCA